MFAITVRVFGDRPAPFELAEDDGETFAFATGAVNRYGRTVVRFPPLAIRAGAKTEIVVRSEQKVK